MRQVVTTMRARLVPMFLAAGLLVGCQYRWGSMMHPQIRSIAIGNVTNATREPQLEGRLKAKLADRIMVDGSLALTTVAKADSILVANIRSVTYETIASTKQRDENARQEDKDEYQSTLFRATVLVDVTVNLAGSETPLVATRTVRGIGDYNRLPDFQVARRAAYDLALRDAAAKAVAEITEAW